DLFRLDHLTTRMRRNAESLLVLVGSEPARTWSRSVELVNVVRAALSEIEAYERVDFDEPDPALLKRVAVADVAHLLAELLEPEPHGRAVPRRRGPGAGRPRRGGGARRPGRPRSRADHPGGSDVDGTGAVAAEDPYPRRPVQAEAAVAGHEAGRPADPGGRGR